MKPSLPMPLCWKPTNTPREIRSLLKTLSTDGVVLPAPARGLSLTFESMVAPGVCEITRTGSSAHVRYATPAQAARAVGALMSGLVADGAVYRETTTFTTLGIMLDCSRNAVMTVEHLKVWLRRLALLGYNMVMLYTEDTYELPDEPFFGYQRGAYTPDEIKAIDDYAHALNIEIVPCIQTLGHLEKILRHAAYAGVKDTGSVLLVDEPKTYELIEKMIRHWRSLCRTHRIHIGMDETHDLGRGRYLDRFGYHHGVELFNKHLQRVVAICERHQVKPMIWSDMYFRLSAKNGGYYEPGTVIAPDVIKNIPREVELVYWDYYHREKAFYLDWIAQHRAMRHEPLMGSGIWTWNEYWYNRGQTECTAGPCIDACREAQVKEIFFTQWGDNGAYCDHDSAFAGMVFCADKCYGFDTPAADTLERRMAAVCGGSYAMHLLASDLHGPVPGFKASMWGDPLFETEFRTFAKDDPKIMTAVADAYAALAGKLKPRVRDRAVGDFRYAYGTAQALADRYALAADLLAAYQKKNRRALAAGRNRIPGVRRSVRNMADAFRAMWMRHNKPEGIETIQARFGMLDERYRELYTRLGEYLDGSIDHIAEWDNLCVPLAGKLKAGLVTARWSDVEATARQPKPSSITRARLPRKHVTFRPVPCDPAAGFADIRKFHEGQDGLIYVRGRITMKKRPKGPGVLYYGADGPVRAWVNGKEVACEPGATNPILPMRFQAPVTWRQGVNEVLFALDSHGGQAWGLAAEAGCH